MINTTDKAFDNLLAASQAHLDLLQELVSRTEAVSFGLDHTSTMWVEPALQLMDPAAHFSDEERQEA